MSRTQRSAPVAPTRFQVINTALADVARRRSGALSAQRVAEIEEVFGDLDSFLLSVFRRWAREVEARLDEPTDDGAMICTQEDMRDLCVRISERNPALVTLLDHHSRNAALTAAVARHRDGLISTLGFGPPLYAFPGTDAVGLGRSA